MTAVTLEKEGHIAWVTLNRPPANALNFETYNAIYDAVQQVDADDDIFVGIFKAEGRIFSAGNDVHELDEIPGLTAGQAAGRSDACDRAVQSFGFAAKPWISLVNGAAVGAGFEIPAFSDIVIATPKARFGIPEVSRGIVGGNVVASSVFPPHITRYLSLTGKTIDAQRSYELGFVWKVVDEKDLIEAGRQAAQDLLDNPPLTVRYQKESLRKVYSIPRLNEIMASDADLKEKSKNSEDFQEAIHSFLEKRPPVYKAR